MSEVVFMIYKEFQPHPQSLERTNCLICAGEIVYTQQHEGRIMIEWLAREYSSKLEAVYPPFTPANYRVCLNFKFMNL